MKLSYVIRPSIPIRGVFEKTICKEEQRKLEKDEVKICIKHGAVFRKFDLENIVRVNLLNIDRLHNEKFISEEEWNKMNVKEVAKAAEPEVIVAPVVEETEPEVAKDFEVTEPAEEETPVEPEVEEVAEIIEEDTVEETPVEPEVEEVAEIMEEDTVEEETKKEAPVSYNSNNGGKKKRR